MQRYYTITQLTQEFDITTRTLRFYEAQGLVSPTRRGRQRLYTPGDRTRIKLILRGKRLGFSLNEIKEMIEMYGSAPGETGPAAAPPRQGSPPAGQNFSKNSAISN